MSRGTKRLFEEDMAFTTPGECTDEVVMEFSGDSRKLYVSKNFLSYASPVFKAMFSDRSKFKESDTNKVMMHEKKYDDMLEFLLHLHPAIQKPVSESNVATLIPLVSEYMVNGSKPKCTRILLSMARKERVKDESGQDANLEAIFQILQVASTYDYNEVMDSVSQMISRWTSFNCVPSKVLYHTLPARVKVRILEGRLNYNADEICELFK